MLMRRLVRRRALGLHNDVNLFSSVVTLLPSERKLVARLGVRLVAGDDAVAPVRVHLDAHDKIEHECESKAGRDQRIVDLLRSGE